MDPSLQQPQNQHPQNCQPDLLPPAQSLDEAAVSLKHIHSRKAPQSCRELGGNAGFKLSVQFPRQLL